MKMDLDTILYYSMLAAAALISLTLHECAHGYTALLLGDPTAKASGRLTLNPVKHIDIFGLVMMILLKIGYAKPVPINPYYFRNRRRGIFLTSAAGPAANLILAVLFGRLTAASLRGGWNIYLVLFFVLMCQLNVGLAVFNLLPFPPLDGSKMFVSLLPAKWEQMFYRYQKYFYGIVLILYFTRVLNKIIDPVINYIYRLLIS